MPRELERGRGPNIKAPPTYVSVAEIAARDNPKDRGFNYGQPLGIATQDQAAFDKWEQTANHESWLAISRSQRAWRLDMALRNIRHATTLCEYEAAITCARATFETWDESRYLKPSVYSFAEIAAATKPPVVPTSENLTDAAIAKRNLRTLLRTARTVASLLPSGAHTPILRDLDQALLPFANVDTAND